MATGICDSKTEVKEKPQRGSEYKVVYYHGMDTGSYPSCIPSLPKRCDDVKTVRKTLEQHEKIKVNLQITKIYKHVSKFDFEEEYEEI